MKNYWSKKDCDAIIALSKDNTSYFNNNKPMTFDAMYEMLRHRMGFGIAETNTIIACLIKCGAKFI